MQKHWIFTPILNFTRIQIQIQLKLRAEMDGPSRLGARRGCRRTLLFVTVHLRDTQTPQIINTEKGTPCRVQQYLTQDSRSR